MTPSPDNRERSLLRTPSGLPLTGFARNFLRESINTALHYPQTQAVIQVAVARVILQTQASGRLSEIREVVDDLSKAQPSLINIKAIAEFVHQKYQKLGFSFPRIPDEKYHGQFIFQINCALRFILQAGAYFLDSPESEKMRLAMEEIGDGCSPDRLDLRLDALQYTQADFCMFFDKVLAKAIVNISRNPEPPELLKFLVEGICAVPRERWGMEVLFPYGSRITKLMDSAVSKAFADTDSPLVVESPIMRVIARLPPMPKIESGHE